MFKFLKQLFCSHDFHTFDTTHYGSIDAVDWHQRCTKCGWRRNVYNGEHVPPHVRKAAYENKAKREEKHDIKQPEKSAIQVLNEKKLNPSSSFDLLDLYPHKIDANAILSKAETARKILEQREENRQPSNEPEPQLTDLISIFDNLWEYEVVITDSIYEQVPRHVKIKALSKEEAQRKVLADNPGFYIQKVRSLRPVR